MEGDFLFLENSSRIGLKIFCIKVRSIEDKKTRQQHISTNKKSPSINNERRFFYEMI